ncbi:MAG: hypothetical protein ACXV8J_04225 [Methylobacter sp.]
MLDVIYMANWILHAHDSEGRSDTKEYLDLFQKLMAYAKDMGCEDLVEFDEQQKKYAESFIFEEKSPALAYIDEFENGSFWAELISRLAHQDALIELKANDPQEVETEELFAAISKSEDKWSKEFEAFGLSRIRLNKTLGDTIH